MKKISKKFYEELVELSNKFDENGLEVEANLVDNFLVRVAQTDDTHTYKDADGDNCCDVCGCKNFKVACAQCGDTKSHKIGGDDGIVSRGSVMGAVGEGLAQGTTGAVKGGATGAVTGGVVGSMAILVGAVPGGSAGAVVGGKVGAVIGVGSGIAEGAQQQSQQ